MAFYSCYSFRATSRFLHPVYSFRRPRPVQKTLQFLFIGLFGTFNHHHKTIVGGTGTEMMFPYKGRHLAEITKSQYHAHGRKQTVSSNMIGIQAGKAKCGLPPKFSGQSYARI